MRRTLKMTAIGLGIALEGGGEAHAAAPVGYAVHARDTLTIEDDAVVYGSIGVHSTGGDAYRVVLGAGARVDPTEVIAAESVLLHAKAVVGAIDATTLVDQGASHGAVGPMIGVDDVVGAAPFSHGTREFEVEGGHTRAIEPGDYGEVEVEAHGTLRLLAASCG